MGTINHKRVFLGGLALWGLLEINLTALLGAWLYREV